MNKMGFIEKQDDLLSINYSFNLYIVDYLMLK